jgi:outer membrane protein assembly factor BamB
MRAAPLALAGLILGAGTAQAQSAGYRGVGKAELTPRYGLTRAIELGAERALFSLGAEEWTSPAFSSDGDVVLAASARGVLTAVEARRGAVLWTRDDLGRPGRAMLAPRSHQMIVGAGVDVVALDLLTGKEIWRAPVGGELGGPMTRADDMIIVPVRPNGFAAVRATDGEILWRHKRPVPDGITVRGQAAPVVQGPHVFLGFSDGALECARIADGTVVWSVALGKAGKPFADIDASPRLVEGGKTVLAASYAGGLHGVDAETGRIQWSKPELTHITHLIDVPGSRLLVASIGDGEVVGLSAAGTVRWRYRLKKGGVPTEAVSVGRGLVMVGASDGPSVLLELGRGKPVQLFDPGSGLRAAPAARGDDLALFTNSGLLLLYRHGRGNGIDR